MGEGSRDEVSAVRALGFLFERMIKLSMLSISGEGEGFDYLELRDSVRTVGTAGFLPPSDRVACTPRQNSPP
jgi:hypothetical protein